MPELNEKSTQHHFFLQAFGYPVAGRYRNAPHKSSDILPVQEKKTDPEKQLIAENIPNGAILHHYWYLQGTPYPVAGSYRQAKKEEKPKPKSAFARAIDAIVSKTRR